MKLKQGAIAAAVMLLAYVYHLPAQSNGRGPDSVPPAPKPINLDLPPEEPADQVQAHAQERAQAEQAIRDPETFHEWVLSQTPGRRKQEQEQAQAIVNPSEYRRAHPKPPGLIQAEAVAAHAILNPHFDAATPPGHN